MSRRDPKKINRPFECLGEMISVKKLPPDDRRAEKPPSRLQSPPDPEEESRIFREAMRDVEPLPGPTRTLNRRAKPVVSPESRSEDLQVLMKLEGLIRTGRGFVIADTSEYIEGSGYLAPPDITARLHRGDFSIQDHIDLHGLTVAEAKATFEGFMLKSIGRGKRAVLIIHGRGLSSPDRPVLKTKVYQWLTRSRWRKWVIAFTSARPCDGGAGASYILLRRRPLTKRQLKKKSASAGK
jgi:DNA-nicking Smr family endonuclease